MITGYCTCDVATSISICERLYVLILSVVGMPVCADQLPLQETCPLDREDDASDANECLSIWYHDCMHPSADHAASGISMSGITLL